MKLYSFEFRGARRLGVEVNGQLVDLNAADATLAAAGRGTRAVSLPSDMLTFLQQGEAAMESAQRTAESVRERGADGGTWTRAWDQVRLLAPVPRPGKMLCAGVNFKSHMLENPKAKRPEFPRIFFKVASVVIGPADPIICPLLTEQLDYEVELAAVIGRTARRVSPDAALDYVAGYTIVNDVSARDIQARDGYPTLGKNFDTFAPMGPCMVTADEFGDPNRVRLRTWVNGEPRQDGTTADWIFPIRELVVYLSQILTLEPGDLILTGTPAGVGLFRTPPVFLKPGDVVRMEIDGIGRLENKIMQE